MSSLFGDPIVTNEVIDQMFKYYDQTVAFAERDRLSRTDVHPFVAGYIDAVLEDWPFHDIESITERTYAQMIRDCGYFFWQGKDYIGEQGFLYGIPYEAMGAAFWHSRQGHFGSFDMQDWPYAKELEGLIPRFNPCWVIEQESGEYEGQLDYVWKDPNGFDFT
jgi:hypothetical protein